ncbi:hypothetical protein V6N11_040897 [Hibiscus sabdariffa]|uniref:Uncharacterized protein n=1 Tax=Hibiscus sabdariffa TaxID=183260 RepID=A0ABR2RIW8_9ROSI
MATLLVKGGLRRKQKCKTQGENAPQDACTKHCPESRPLQEGLVLKGRRRNKMSSTQGENARQDADTKRSDFLKKVSELCALFVFKAALIFFSPSSKALRSGHSDVGANIDSRDNLAKLIVQEITYEEAKIWININKLFEEYADVRQKVKVAKLRRKQLERMKLENERKGQRLRERPIDELNLEELLIADAETKEFIEKLKKVHQERLAKDATSNSMSIGGTNAS